MKTYDELIKLPTIRERYDYLKLSGVVGEDTVGSLRWWVEKFYSSSEWKRFRNGIILRDNGCDLGVDGYPIGSKQCVIHHIEPITATDIVTLSSQLMDSNNCVSVSRRMHDALHYGAPFPYEEIVVRRPNDTCPWRL